jgi:glycosyltransferase involved in cell wall biosynthesis
VREVLTPDVDAVLVAAGNPAALSAGIRRVLSDPDLGARLAHAAATAVLDYTWERRAERLEALLETVIAGRQ